MWKPIQRLFERGDDTVGTLSERVALQLNVLDRIAIQHQLRQVLPLVTSGNTTLGRLDAELASGGGLNTTVHIDRRAVGMLSQLMDVAKASPLEADYLVAAREEIARHGDRDPALRDYLLARVEQLEVDPDSASRYGWWMIVMLAITAIELLQLHYKERHHL